MKFKNRKAIAPLIVVGYIALILVGIYIFLWILPAKWFPSVAVLRQTINYFIVLGFWVLIQLAVIIGIYKIISFLYRAIKDYKRTILKWDLKVKNFIIRH